MVFSLKYCSLNVYQKEFQSFLGKRYKLNIITYEVLIESYLYGNFYKQSNDLSGKNSVLTDCLIKIINCEDTTDTTLQSIVGITTDSRLLIPIMKHKNVSDTTLDLILGIKDKNTSILVSKEWKNSCYFHFQNFSTDKEIKNEFRSFK